MNYGCCFSKSGLYLFNTTRRNYSLWVVHTETWFPALCAVRSHVWEVVVRRALMDAGLL